MAIINRVWRWSYELKNISFKNREALRFSKKRISVVSFNYGRWKKKVFEKGRYYAYFKSNMKSVGRNQAEEILSILIFQDLIKSQSFLHQRRSQRDSNQSQFLIDFFLLMYPFALYSCVIFTDVNKWWHHQIGHMTFITWLFSKTFIYSQNYLLLQWP